MINLNCPHCSSLDHFQAAIAEPEGETYTVFIEVYGKLWRWPRPIKPKQDDPSGRHKPDPEAQKLVTVVEHGKYSLITLDENNFVPSWRGFKVEILGMDYGLALPPPPGPLFLDLRTIGNGSPGERKIFNACRVTTKRSKVDVRIHWWPDHSSVVAALGGADRNETVQWWPDHGRIVTVRGLTLGRINTQELDQLNRSLTLFRTEAFKIGDDSIGSHPARLPDAIPLSH